VLFSPQNIHLGENLVRDRYVADWSRLYGIGANDGDVGQLGETRKTENGSSSEGVVEGREWPLRQAVGEGPRKRQWRPRTKK
jgi:hypothetical protein